MEKIPPLIRTDKETENLVEIVSKDQNTPQIKPLEQLQLESSRPSWYTFWLDLEEKQGYKEEFGGLTNYIQLQYHSQGRSQRDLAKDFGISRSAVNKLMKKVGISARERTEALRTLRCKEKAKKGGRKTVLGQTKVRPNQPKKSKIQTTKDLLAREIKEEIVAAALNEIRAHQTGKINQLRTTKELADELNTAALKVRRVLTKNLPEDERTYRIKILQSQLSKRLWQDPEYTAVQDQGVRKRWQDEGAREKHAKILSKRSREMWAKGKNRDKMVKLMSEKSKRLWANQEYRERRKKQTSDWARKLWQDPTHRKKMSAVGKRSGNKLARESQRICWLGNKFHSQEEAAIATLFERYIPEWGLEQGKTWQIRDGGLNCGGIDFMINGEFIEYHPPKPYCSKKGSNGDFRTHKEYEKYKAILGKIEERDGLKRAKEFARKVRYLIARAYTEKRKEIIANSRYAGTSLIYCSNIHDIYNRVISRDGRNAPTEEEFVREFKKLKKNVKAFNEAKE
ncbi:MAG: hypothetical protein ABH864_01245 [archaeon]